MVLGGIVLFLWTNHKIHDMRIESNNEFNYYLLFILRTVILIDNHWILLNLLIFYFTSFNFRLLRNNLLY